MPSSLNVRIGAKINDFLRGMGKVEGHLKSSASTIRTLGKGMTAAITLPMAGAALAVTRPVSLAAGPGRSSRRR